MVSEAIDFHYLLLENYKKLKISELELATIFEIDHLISLGEKFVTADLLSFKMNLDEKEIDKILASLLSKGFLEFTTVGKKTVTTLDPLKDKLSNEFQLSLSKEKELKRSTKIKQELDLIFLKYEELLQRSLSPVEISKIKDWVAYGYTSDMIIDALKDSIGKGSKSLQSVDKILLNYKIRDDMESDGMTTISKDWDKNLEETIKIAKTPWLDDKDE